LSPTYCVMAVIIMGDHEAALIRLWREKRGEVEPEYLSGNLVEPNLRESSATPDRPFWSMSAPRPS
jgi:hypothetical protein